MKPRCIYLSCDMQRNAMLSWPHVVTVHGPLLVPSEIRAKMRERQLCILEVLSHYVLLLLAKLRFRFSLRPATD